MFAATVGGVAVFAALLAGLAYFGLYKRPAAPSVAAAPPAGTDDAACDAIHDEPAEPRVDERMERIERIRGLVQTLLSDTSSTVQSMLTSTTAYSESLDQHRSKLANVQTEAARQEIEERLLRELDEMQTLTNSYRDQLEQARGTIRTQEALILKMKEDAGHDALLQIPNRGSFDARIAEEFARAARYNSMLCVVLIDVDHFKGVNDNYGHVTGDRVLQGVARVLNEQCRQHDFVARYGGEEFAFILPQTELRQARLMADRARRRIASCRFLHNGTSVSVTCSAGVAQCRPGDDSIEDLIDRADKALYAGKQNGRNCVMADSEDSAAAIAPNAPEA
jgi:diguanylate cyclase